MAEQPEERKISKHEFYFETALYEPIKKSSTHGDVFSGTVDAYNSLDGFDTTYEIHENTVYNYGGWEPYHRITLSCKRGGKSELRFFTVDLQGGYIMKVGQFPSLADIQFATISNRYNRYLPEEDLRNYKKAVGLRAHGIGAGSFVYLRKIFENLIDSAYEENKEGLELIKEDFFMKRMDEKVEALKLVLPSQLVEMKKIYGLLSKGVHKLSENECLKYFSPLKLSIELILDQKIEERLKANKDAAVKKELYDILASEK